MTNKEEFIYFRELKARPAETIVNDNNIKNNLPKQLESKKMNGLTWKSVLALIIIALAKAVLTIWFDAETVSKIIPVIQEILNSLGLTAAAAAAWGIRRRIDA